MAFIDDADPTHHVSDGRDVSPRENTHLELHRYMMELAFKIPNFRGVQADVILHSSVRGEDVVVVWKTGGGKTLLFAVPALLDDGLAVVVLPLISLVEDLYEQLISRHIGTVYMHHQLPADRIRCARLGLLVGVSGFWVVGPFFLFVFFAAISIAPH